MTIILYGLPHSLYTGKTRAYLRKQGLVYEERAPSHPHFQNVVLPAIGRGIIPVVVLEDGTIIQDTVDILDHFEEQGVRCTARPPASLQRVLAHIAELYAVTTLTRHAMHYRWSYFDEQAAFLTHAFAIGSGPEAAAKIMGRMQSYLPALGVTERTIPVIEKSFEMLIQHLNAHFEALPYLFGAQPSIGDYGLFGPLFAHLGRDPVPEAIMKAKAPSLYRWVERMNAPDADIPEYPDMPAGYHDNESLPATLTPIFKQMGEELFPELSDKLEGLKAIVESRDPQPGEPVTEKPHQRLIGTVHTSFRGVACEIGLQPYGFFLWARVVDAWKEAQAGEQNAILNYLTDTGLAPLLTNPLPIRFERRNHLEVWGERSEAL